MPPSNEANGSSTPLHKRKQPSVPGRIVPAIPLALSKPKVPRSQAQPVGDSKGQATNDVKAGAKSTATRDDTDLGLVNGNKDPNSGHLDSQPSVKQSLGLTPTPMEDGILLSETPGSRGSAPMSESTGDTPELPSSHASEPKTPPKPSIPSPAVTTSPQSSRKPTDRFDMRQVRTELPPAFVPSAERHTPQSASSSLQQDLPLNSHMHPSRPSTSSIVFGGPESASSSPAPPSAGSHFQAPPYLSFGGMHHPYSGPPGHSHHSSEPFGQRTYYPHFPLPQSPWGIRQTYTPLPQSPLPHPHAHMPFRYPPRETFTPRDIQQPNGLHPRSRSMSQESSAAARPSDDLQSPNAIDSKGSFSSHHYPRHSLPNGQNGMPLPPHMAHPDVVGNLHNAEALRDHVFSHFSHPALADCHLQMQDDHGGRQYLDAHKLILSRSTTLFELIQNSEPPESATLKTQVHIQLKGRYVRLTSFNECLRYLYGGRVLPLDQSRWSESAGTTNEQHMEVALQHIATGAWLKVPAIAIRGVEVAANLLHWDTLNAALAFSLDGGLSPVWSIDDGSEDKFSCSSSDDSLGRESSPVYDPYATQLLHRIITFIVHVFPQNFYLDATAPQLEACQRLPSVPLGHESRSSRSDPRLSQIRFGEMSMEDHQRPSPIATMISSLLLSLPFVLLKCLLEHFALVARLGPDTVASIMRQVVAEREARRAKGLKSHNAGRQDDTADAQLVQNLFWEESVEPSPQHRAGFRLARRRRDVDTPPSSGGEPEPSK